MTRTAPTVAALLAALSFIALPAVAETPKAENLTPAFLSAGAKIQRLLVFEVGGVVVIRGKARTEAEKAAATDIATALGYTRVANLVRITAAPDDQAIERLAERELAVHRGLDGCTFSVAAHDGVIRLAGRVHHELQKDMALAVLRSIEGVRGIESTLVRD